MEKDKPRLTRLASVMTQLQSGNIITARQISERYGISIRTVYRDIKTLEQSGIPIVTEEGKGYSIMEGYRLPPVMFTEEEANALITAEHLISTNSDSSLVKHYNNAVTKIKAVLKTKQISKSEFLSSRIQVRNNKASEATSNYLITFQSAIVNFQLIEIQYLSLEKKKTTRLVEPFALYTTNGNWLLIAFCQKRNDFRAFRLDCIQNIQIVNKTFQPHNITLEKFLDECRKKCSTPDTSLT